MQQTLDTLTGVATGLRLIPRPPGGPRIFNATTRMANTTGYLGVQANDRNGGAGLTVEAAKSAALGEAVERYCAAARDSAILTTASVEALLAKGEDPVVPEEIALFDEAQKKGLPFAFFRRDTRLSWLRGVSLVTGRTRMVPASLVHLPYRPVDPDEQNIGPSISTGLSCGRTRLAAVLSGLYECVERDAFAIMWRNRLPARRLILANSPLSTVYEERFASINLHFHLFHIEFDHAVPTVFTIVEDRNFDPPVICLGGAARATAADAALKALIEGAQGWTWARYERLLGGTRSMPGDFDEITSFDERVKLYACCDMRDALAFLLDQEDVVDLGAFDNSARQDSVILGQILSQANTCNSDIIAVDLTTPEIAQLGLTAVKVICPAFEQVEGDHRFQLLGGTRWRNVPLSCGYRNAPAGLSDINPFPHPYP